MFPRPYHSFLASVLLLAGMLACGGGGGGTTPPVPAVVTVSLNPSSASLNTGATQAFTATVANASNTAVTWAVTESAGGNVSASGLYTAPASISGASATFHVVATSQADSSRSATATVTVTPPPVTVAITPASVSLVTNQSQVFSATVGNASNAAVTFSIQEGAAGGGLYNPSATSTTYVAPNTPGTYHVVATSVADPSRSASAVVSVADSGISVTVSPASVNLLPGAQQQFTATVTGNTNHGVYWSAAPGSIDANGLYTAPYSSGVVTVYATSAVDSLKTGSATVTVLSNIAVGVAPVEASVAVGGTLKFAAQVTGGSSNAATWSVQEGAAGGSIASTGVYSAPAAAGTFHIVATSTQDASKSAIGTVHVVAALPVAVQAWPARVILGKGAAQTFAAKVLNAVNAQVAWSVQEGAAGGAVTAGGVYTAPAAKGVYHVVAAAQADPAKKSVLTVHVVDDPGGSWVPTLAMGNYRNAHSATLLQDGKVLVVGGWDNTNLPTPQTSAELFDPATGAYTPTGSLAVGRAYHATVLLPTGKVLLIGGQPSFSSHGTQNIDLYDPAAGTFTPWGSLVQARGNCAAVLLPDGNVLVAGGGATAPAEIFDPVAKVSRLVGSSPYFRGSGTFAMLLPTGKVLIFGGQGGSESIYKECELYDPETDTIVATGSASKGRLYSGAALLPDGRVLNAGGLNSVPGSNTYANNYSGEIYYPGTGQWSLSGSMSAALTSSYVGALQVLGDGRVMVAMGQPQPSQLFNAATGTFQNGSQFPYTLMFPTASVLLLDGRMLVMGGNYATGTSKSSVAFQ